MSNVKGRIYLSGIRETQCFLRLSTETDPEGSQMETTTETFFFFLIEESYIGGHDRYS
jgi:hypothetical protein